MSLKYSIIEIFTGEEARYHGKPLYEEVVQYIRGLKIAARCMVIRGIEGCYENGEIATQSIMDISFNMPVLIKIILPYAQTDLILPKLEEMVNEGIIAVREMDIQCHKTEKRLIPRHLKVRRYYDAESQKRDAVNIGQRCGAASPVIKFYRRSRGCRSLSARWCYFSGRSDLQKRNACKNRTAG